MEIAAKLHRLSHILIHDPHFPKVIRENPVDVLSAVDKTSEGQTVRTKTQKLAVCARKDKVARLPAASQGILSGWPSDVIKDPQFKSALLVVKCPA
jgi:hypothetical protein